MEENLFVNVEYSPVKHQLHGFLSEKNVTKKTKLFHTDEKVFVFMLRTSDLELVSSRRLDSGTNIQSVKSASSNFHSELKVVVLPPLEENNKRRKTKKKRDKSKNLFMKSVYNTILSAIIKHPDKETVREIGCHKKVHNTVPLS